jgi:hypothetical protein
MPEPLTTTLLVLSATAQVAGSIQQARAVKQAGKDEQAVNERNALISRQQAKEEERKAALESRQHKERVHRARGENQAIIGASGLTSEGSPLLLLEENAKAAAEDNFLILREGQLRSNRLQDQANIDVFKGRVAKKAGSRRARSILTSGAKELFRAGIRGGELAALNKSRGAPS